MKVRPSLYEAWEMSYMDARKTGKATGKQPNHVRQNPNHHTTWNEHYKSFSYPLVEIFENESIVDMETTFQSIYKSHLCPVKSTISLCKDEMQVSPTFPRECFLFIEEGEKQMLWLQLNMRINVWIYLLRT